MKKQDKIVPSENGQKTGRSISPKRAHGVADKPVRMVSAISHQGVTPAAAPYQRLKQKGNHSSIVSRNVKR